MPTEYESPLAKKLNLESGMKVRVLARPADVDLIGLSTTDAVDADGMILFVRTLADVDAGCGPVLDAARLDRVVWWFIPRLANWVPTSIAISSGGTCLKRACRAYGRSLSTTSGARCDSG